MPQLKVHLWLRGPRNWNRSIKPLCGSNCPGALTTSLRQSSLAKTLTTCKQPVTQIIASYLSVRRCLLAYIWKSSGCKGLWNKLNVSSSTATLICGDSIQVSRHKNHFANLSCIIQKSPRLFKTNISIDKPCFPPYRTNVLQDTQIKRLTVVEFSEKKLKKCPSSAVSILKKGGV